MPTPHEYEKIDNPGQHMQEEHPGFAVLDPGWRHNPHVTHEAMHRMEEDSDPKNSDPDDWSCQQYGYHLSSSRHSVAVCRSSR